jgi:hypothetical protein
MPGPKTRIERIAPVSVIDPESGEVLPRQMVRYMLRPTTQVRRYLGRWFAHTGYGTWDYLVERIEGIAAELARLLLGPHPLA